MTRVSLEKMTAAVQAFCEQFGRGPSYRELADLAGYASKQAAYRLAERLIEAGVLSRDDTGRLIPSLPRLGIKLLGTVQAGFPTPAEEELVDTLSLDEFLIEKPNASYLLQVSGDSMIDAGIHEGDMVVVEKGPNPKNGDIVIAEVDGDWTMKYYYKRAQQIELEPANPNFSTITASLELRIGGIVKSVVRKY